MSGSTKLKIAVLGLKGFPAKGGGARAGESVIMRLKDRFQITVFSMDSYALDRGPHPEVRQIILRTFGFRGMRLFLYYLFGAISILKDSNNYDLVHLQHGMAGFVAPLLRSKFPLVLTIRGGSINMSKDSRFGPVALWLLKKSEEFALKHCHQVVSVARPHADKLRKEGFSNVRWIPNGVETILEAGGNPSSGDLFLSFAAARIIPLKGLHLVIEAIKIAGVEIELRVKGDLDIDQKYKTQIVESTIGVKVSFLGLDTDKERLLSFVRDSKLFLFPSYSEAMSNMLLEALSVGTPVVCSDIPENRAVIEEDEATFFKSGSASDLAEKLDWALRHPVIVQERAIKVKERIGREFNWDAISEDYARLYHVTNQGFRI